MIRLQTKTRISHAHTAAIKFIRFFEANLLDYPRLHRA
jgi:hypothetical protein